MASNTIAAFIPLLFFGAIAITVFAVTANTTKKTQKQKRYTSKRDTQHQQQQQTQQQYQPQHYIPQISAQMELDLRLPYRRFKQIYPNNNITYEEYKKMQIQSSFKHAISSQKNHRMVR